MLHLFNKRIWWSEEKIFRDSRADYVLKISAKYHEGLNPEGAVGGDFKKAADIYRPDLRIPGSFQDCADSATGQLMLEEYLPEELKYSLRTKKRI